MRRFACSIIIVVSILSGAALAVSPGKRVEYRGGPLGKVVFSGSVHDEAGYKCMDCHNRIFSIRSSEKVSITQSTHQAGKFCGVCHDGEKAFSIAEKKDCSKCHILNMDHAEGESN